jgi:hypothetical protein
LSHSLTPKRGLSRQEAAEYVGCKTLAAFDDWRGRGVLRVNPIPGTTKYDKKALDAALDAASGLRSDDMEQLSPYQRWKAEQRAG